MTKRMKTPAWDAFIACISWASMILFAYGYGGVVMAGVCHGIVATVLGGIIYLRNEDRPDPDQTDYRKALHVTRCNLIEMLVQNRINTNTAYELIDPITQVLRGEP